jgi:hypothetical protein
MDGLCEKVGEGTEQPLAQKENQVESLHLPKARDPCIYEEDMFLSTPATLCCLPSALHGHQITMPAPMCALEVANKEEDELLLALKELQSIWGHTAQREACGGEGNGNWAWRRWQVFLWALRNDEKSREQQLRPDPGGAWDISRKSGWPGTCRGIVGWTEG